MTNIPEEQVTYIHRVKAPKPSASGVCFYLVVILQFPHLVFMFNKIIWSLGAEVIPFLFLPQGQDITSMHNRNKAHL